MNLRSSKEREIRELSIAANSGEASDEQIARLDALVREDPYLANYAARVFDQQAALAWQGSMCDRSEAAASDITPAPVARASADAEPRGISLRRSGWSWPTIAVGIAFLLGMAAAQLAPFGKRGEESAAGQPTYKARLISSTACLWDGNSVGSREIGSWVTSGDSLHLLEGLAEFNLNWSAGGSATLSLEGPAAMMLTSEGMPTLRFGRLTATINASYRPFVLETPVGRLVIEEYGSIGVSAFGNDGEIHVFDGSASLEPAWPEAPREPGTPLRIEADEAVRIQEGPDGELNISRHKTDEGYFVAQLSMKSDALAIPPSYVAAVKKAAPIGYWRFNRATSPEVANEMGARFKCRIEGELGTTAHQGNDGVEFGVTDQGGEILCDEPVGDELQDEYSVEFWIKPSHYHVGAAISLVGEAESETDVVPHAMLLEMGGTGLIPTAVHHPGRIRFLHRSPASNESELGTSCYSTAAYTLRKWQHMVAVKDASKMRLYINGELAGEEQDTSRLPSGMRLLVGKLYPARRVRPFIGQLDELAIYNRALTADEIAKHYRLVRPPIASKPSI